MATLSQLERAERQATVLRLRAEGLTFSQIGEHIGMSHMAAFRDYKSAISETVGRAAEDYRAVMIARNERLVAALMPKALAGSPRHCEVILAADKRTAELLGLDAPRKVEHLINREYASQLAAEYGLTVDEVLEEAERILKHAAEVAA